MRSAFTVCRAQHRNLNVKQRTKAICVDANATGYWCRIYNSKAIMHSAAPAKVWWITDDNSTAGGAVCRANMQYLWTPAAVEVDILTVRYLLRVPSCAFSGMSSRKFGGGGGGGEYRWNLAVHCLEVAGNGNQRLDFALVSRELAMGGGPCGPVPFPTLCHEDNQLSNAPKLFLILVPLALHSL